MKTLYLSDLDGTLLNKNITVSRFTVDTLNMLIKKGMNFSIATARTISTVSKILEDINLKVPIVLMNGVSVYDTVSKNYLNTEVLSSVSMKNMLLLLKKYNLSGFLFSNENNILNTYYENLDTEHRKNFYAERTTKFGKVFTKVNSFSDCLNDSLIYFSTCDKKAKLSAFYDELKKDDNLNLEFYRDIYLEDYWYLEVSSHKASKFNATNFLKENFGFDRVISFGDNLNDIPMFLASDESYAVSNARDETKSVATGIIDSNINDGIAKWLLENFNA